MSFFHLSENKELLDTVSKQRQMLEDLRKKEIEAYVQVKKSCELAEQAQFEKLEVRWSFISCFISQKMGFTFLG